MNSVTVFLVNLTPEQEKIVREGAASAFDAARLVSAATLAGLPPPSPGEDRAVLVCRPPDEDALAAAVQAMAAGGEPRWALVILGEGPAEVAEVVPAAECTPAMLAHVLRDALLRHELVKENLRLRGGLKTLAHRFSHDLRSPLNCIYITAELLDELIVRRSPTAPQLEMLKASVSEANRLIDRLGFLVKAICEPAGFGPVAMGEAVAGATKRLGEKIMEGGTPRLRAPESWPVAWGVAAWVEEIWWNLLDNALRHGARPSPVKLGWRRQGDHWRFWVENEGPPPAKEIEARMFRGLDQGHGAGLGLGIVQQLVALQRGVCGYERQGGATVFHFTLPAFPASE